MWQPIETAPKDGTRILLWTTTRNVDDAWYVFDFCEGNHLEVVQVGVWEERAEAPLASESGWHKELIGEPTHWQPLPAPPVSESLAA